MNERDRRKAYAVSAALLVIMVAQSALGLRFPGWYRDTSWVRTTWFGNDLVTLAVASPLLGGSLVFARRESVRGYLVWLGTLGYAVYNYAFYMLGAALNAFFPVYVLAVVLSGLALIIAWTGLDASAPARRLHAASSRWIGGYMVFVAAGLTSVWLMAWAAYVFAGRSTPADLEVFRLVAALDLVLMVPALAFGGILLWRRSSWGYVVAAAAAIQGTLYLLVLATNAYLAIRSGIAGGPGELPLWGTLLVCTAAASVKLLAERRR